MEQELFDLFTRCAAWNQQTEGAFDIATGALVKAWGFFRRDGRVPTPRERNAAMACTGFRHVILDPEAQLGEVPRSGLELNLGAVGKGYALDRAAQLLYEEWGVRSALLHGGGSSAYGMGAPPAESRGWPVRLKHPTEPGQSLGTVYLRDRGLGTSAATFQFFEYNGEKLGHLLDPRTGWPARGTASASVMAPTAAEADAMSTAAFVLGADGTERLTRLNPALGAVLLADEPDREPAVPQPRRGIVSALFGPIMTNLPIPIEVLYAGLAGTILALIVATIQNNWSIRVFFLLALRLAIGWHFLFEGLYKVNTHLVGPTDANPRTFTSEPYFRNAPGPVAAYMRKQFSDPQAAIADHLTPSREPRGEAFANLPIAEQAAACPASVAKQIDDMEPKAVEAVKAEAKKELAKADEDEAKATKDAKTDTNKAKAKESAEAARQAAQEGRDRRGNRQGAHPRREGQVRALAPGS